ncbi:hypothetical protein HC891_06205 [Candidatus Gracilibacteria bacterium]|nr:hypothetical protein [Candidatus Gracilibacteria bacterium]
MRALTPVDLLELPAAEFHRLIDQRPEMAAQVRSIVAQRNQRNAELRHDVNLAQNMVLAVERPGARALPAGAHTGALPAQLPYLRGGLCHTSW